jgi:tetratricopeptide (TPR) repeat protein
MDSSGRFLMNDDLRAEIRHLQERYDRAPESRIFAPLADACRKGGDVDRAIALCEKGLERYPDYASAHVILGKCFYDKGATERSRAEFERVIEIDPENMVALKFMGDILMSEGDREGATSCYRRILAIDPTNEEVSGKLEGLENEFREKEIDLSDDSSYRKSGKTDELATMTLAGIYTAQGYYNKALKIYREILEAEPGNSEASEMIGKIETMIESSNRELEETFDEEVMSISIDDVSDDMAENTAGPGTGSPDEGDGEEEPAEVDEEAGIAREGSVLGDEDELEAVARELEEADRRDSGEGTPPDEEPRRGAAREGMENFRKWLERAQDDSKGSDN